MSEIIKKVREQIMGEMQGNYEQKLEIMDKMDKINMYN